MLSHIIILFSKSNYDYKYLQVAIYHPLGNRSNVAPLQMVGIVRAQN